MESLNRSCAAHKCETFSCAVCHCCQTNLCLDHLKEHRDQLTAKLMPLTNQINTFLNDLEHFTPASLPSLMALEQWRNAAHQTVDQFYQHMHRELLEQAKNKPLEKLRAARDTLDRLIQRQGATCENIDSLTTDIQLIEQEINSLRNIPINLRPLVIDDNIIIQPNSSNRTKSHILTKKSPAAAAAAVSPATTSATQNDLEALQNGTAFQIFVELDSDKRMTVTVKPSDTIKELKRKIQEQKGIPENQQRLILRGKQLKDEYNIATYDIQKQATLNLFRQLQELQEVHSTPQ